MLNRKNRFNIIMGIARGMLYLHEDFRLIIIYRDLKLSNIDLKHSNIFLDDDMNSKISDFGTARIFGRNQTQAQAKRVIST